MKCVLLMPLCFLAAACAEIRPPTASVESVSVEQITPAGFRLDFTVDVTNPNGVALPMAEIDYSLDIGQRDFLHGKARPEEAVPARAKLPVVVPVTIRFDDLLAVSEIIVRSGGDIPYELDATFEFGRGLGALAEPIRLPVRHSGTVRLRELLRDPSIVLQSPAARELIERALKSPPRR